MLPFIHSKVGHALIAYSILSIGIGFLVLNRLVNVEE
jgi:Flp pilus assembly protein TadB